MSLICGSKEILKKWYTKTYRFNQYNRDRWVAEWASRIKAGSHVLDVGAGSGSYRTLFSHCNYRTQDFGQVPDTVYTSLDYVSDITSIPVSDESFDVILCTEVLEHVPEPVLAVKEMYRILKVGGYLLLTAPLGSLLHQEPYHYYGGYTPYWYQKHLSAVGLEIISIERNGGFFSYFGQQAIRFHNIIDPRRVKVDWVTRIVLGFLWICLLPVLRLFPILATPLDNLELEKMATVGYHVIAFKRSKGLE